jgi:hypothetical protein
VPYRILAVVVLRTLDLTARAIVPLLFSWKSRRSRWREALVESAYAVHQWLSREHEVHAKVRLSQAAGSRDAGEHPWAQFPIIKARVAANVPGLRKSTGNGRVRTGDQSRSPQWVTRRPKWER